MRRVLALVLFLGAPLAAAAQENRMASDFEIAQMQSQLAHSKDFVSQLSAHLNLGDLRVSRNERVLATREYEAAETLAMQERITARRASDLTQYANATAYAAIAAARLGSRSRSLSLIEEALRYESGSAKTWNLAASSYSMLSLDAKTESAAKNAIAIAEAAVARDASIANRLDLEVYRHTLAGALVQQRKSEQAETLLARIAGELDAAPFEALRREVAKSESFEIYSTARGDVAAWLSLVNRVNLRLASLLETRGAQADAKQRYRRVLQSRSDDPSALAALARLASSPEERRELFASAFDANPFSIPLIRTYQDALRGGLDDTPQGSSTGAKMRAALVAAARGETRTARTSLESLRLRFPSNDTLDRLLAEFSREGAVPSFLSSSATTADASPEELRSLRDLLADDRLNAEQRAVLDRLELRSNVVFDAIAARNGETTSFAKGTIGTLKFRFPDATAFRGNFHEAVPLLLTFRVAGVTRVDDADGLLLEPLRLEVGR